MSRGMWAVAAALAPHEVFPEVQIRLVLIVGPTAQRDVVSLMLSAFPIGLLVMVLHAARASATTTLLIDERATTSVALPYLASDCRWDGAGSAVASSIAAACSSGGKNGGGILAGDFADFGDQAIHDGITATQGPAVHRAPST